MLPRFTATACLVSATAFVALPSVGVAAELVPLGDLPNGSFNSSGLAVSADGTTAVGRSNSGATVTDNRVEAFRWNSNVMIGLGDLPGGTFDSKAYSVNGDGSVIVGQSNSGTVEVPNRIEAFRWQGTMTGLGDLAGGTFQSYAHAVSQDGLVVAGYSDSTDGLQAFRWENGTMTGLGDLAGGTFNSRALGINGNGSVIVGRGNSQNPDTSARFEAFRWENGNMIGLGDLEGGVFGSQANAVSANGTTVVGHGAPAAGGLQAFRWTSAGMVALDYLPGVVGSSTSEALGVNSDGSVIVGYAVLPPSNSSEAVRWDANGDVERLWDVLLDMGVNPANDGWTQLSRATGISPDGNSIVGFGMRNGNTEGFLVSIPEPASMALLAPAALTLLRRRRQA